MAAMQCLSAPQEQAFRPMDFQTLGPLWGLWMLFESQNFFKTYEMPRGEMVMSKRYKGIENISGDDRHLVEQSFARWSENRHRPNKEDVKLLFAKYHEYIYKSPSDMACPSCVQFIYDYWRGVVANWKENSNNGLS